MTDTRRDARFAWIIGAVLGGVFVWAGVSKLGAPLLFARVAVFLLPEAAKGETPALAVTLVVGVFEVVLGAALALRAGRVAVRAAIVAMVVFSAALIVLIGSSGAPACGCLGPVRSSSAGLDAVYGLVRNLSMLALLAWLLVHPSAPRATTRHPRPGRRTASAGAGGGFTLVELLVSIAVVSVVIALAVPALRHARAASAIARDVDASRQLLVGLEYYAQDYRESLPYLGTPGEPLGPVFARGAALPSIYFRSQRWFWLSVVMPEYVDLPRAVVERSGTAAYLQDVQGYPPEVVVSMHQLTSTAFAAPAYWRDAPGDWDRPEHYRATHIREVAHPSRKGLLIKSISGPGGHAGETVFPVGMADGSASARPPHELRQERTVTRPHGSVSAPVEATKDGLAGVDF